LFEFTPYGYLVTDQWGNIQQANHAASTLLSVEQKHLVGKPLTIFIAQEDSHTCIPQLADLQQSLEWEISIQPRQGKPFPASLKVAPMYDLQDQQSGWIWLLSNISERKQAEAALIRDTEELEKRVAERTKELVATNQALQQEIKERKETEAALRKSEEIFRQFAENMDSYIWICSQDCSNIYYINPAYEKIWGRSCQSLRENPLSWIEAIYPEDIERLMAEVEVYHQQGGNASSEYRIFHPDGSIRWLSARRFPIKNEQGQVEYYGGIGEDITERQQAEVALIKSEQKFRYFTEHSDSLIWMASKDGKETLYINSAYEKIWGRSCQSLWENSQSWKEAIHPEDRDDILAEIEERHQKGEGASLEYRIVQPNGEIRWIWSRCFPIKNEQGNLDYYGSIVEDITERKLADQCLRESEARLTLALDTVNMGIWECNHISHEYIWSDNIGPLYGLPKGTPCPCSQEEFLNLIYPEDHQIFCHAVNQAIEKGEKFTVEYRVIWPDGSLHWLSTTGKVCYNNQGQLIKLIGTTRDISDRKHKEQKLSEQAALLDIATDAIFVRDFQTEILFWNHGAEKIYGWSKEEVIGKNLKDIFCPKTALEQEANALKTVVKSGTWQGELRKQTKSGKAVIVESRWTLIFDADGQPKSILVVDTDITENKQLEEQFLRTQRLESIGALASGIAHDLNNTLTPILASAQLLRGRFANDCRNHPQLLSMIESNARHGSALVKQVLSFARGLKGEQTIVQVKHLITEILQIGKQTFSKAIKFNLQISENLWTVAGEATQIYQVLMNLVVNARDAMPEGGLLTISAANIFIDEAYTRMHPEAKVGHYIAISVSDTGIGMPPEILERIFEPFFTTKEVGVGTGLGLSTVMRILKSHNGFLTVSSQVDKGSSFKVFLPSAESGQNADSEKSEMPLGEGELILVVDDEPLIKDVAKIILENHNYQTLTASNGIEAIALYAQHKHEIRAVIMDMMMPEMDGITAIHTMQRMNPEVKLIASSGLGTIEILTEISDIKVHEVLLKPYTASDLLHCVRQVIRNS
jgi:PAS domain S-box-containing protein